MRSTLLALLPLVAASPTFIIGEPTTNLTSPGGGRSTPIGIHDDGNGAGYDGPNPDEIQIVDVSFSGNGCPQGSVATSISADRTVVTFGFDQFQTYIGPGFDPTAKTKNCQLHLNLQYPGGFQFAVVESTYHGYAQLDPDVTGTFLSTYYFSQDASASVTTRTSISGKDDNGQWNVGNVYTKTDEVPTASVIYAPCGASGILNVNNRIALASTNPKAVGEITDDDATVAFTQQLHLSWQPCRV